MSIIWLIPCLSLVDPQDPQVLVLVDSIPSNCVMGEGTGPPSAGRWGCMSRGLEEELASGTIWSIIKRLKSCIIDT
jgi:hypothetical protein